MGGRRRSATPGVTVTTPDAGCLSATRFISSADEQVRVYTFLAAWETGDETMIVADAA
jgi:hypothetical protein